MWIVVSMRLAFPAAATIANMDDAAADPAGWDDANTRDCIDFGDIFVPRRDEQFQVVCDLLPPARAPKAVELCCGAGGLSAAPEPDPIDQPSTLAAQLTWMAAAGLDAVDVHWQYAGHAIFPAPSRNNPHA
jgi:hypothetical protein